MGLHGMGLQGMGLQGMGLQGNGHDVIAYGARDGRGPRLPRIPCPEAGQRRDDVRWRHEPRAETVHDRRRVGRRA